MLTAISADIMEKLKILSDAAKFDVACTSSGASRSGNGNDMGSAFASGICHSFTADGRCISLLKILFTNECIYDCKYCINRCTNDVERVTFTPEEVCKLTAYPNTHHIHSVSVKWRWFKYLCGGNSIYASCSCNDSCSTYGTAEKTYQMHNLRCFCSAFDILFC